MNGQKSGAVNIVLMAVVGLLVGFIGGYFIGQRNAPIATTTALAGATTPGAPCPHQLDGKDQWIIAGFRCPGTETEQAALLGCHCPTAHGIEDRVKTSLAAGKTGQQVRDELMMEYGARLNFRTQ
jgi:cytochrome c-type biogenesis protein CcmH/NrfF